MKIHQLGWAVMLLILPYTLHAQKKGIQFEHGLTWTEIKAKAKAGNKYIFMDCFTTWCGPCKMMAQYIFPQQKAGDFFNDKFISVKMQLDKATGDSPEVKALYSDAADVKKLFDVHAYPTFLFFTPDGRLVHKITGALPIIDPFLDKCSAALDTSKQYYTLLDKFKKGQIQDPAVLRNLALAADTNSDKIESQLATAYLATQTDLYTKDNVSFMSTLIKTRQDSSFSLFLIHPDKIDAVIGKGYAARKIQEVALADDYTKLVNGSMEPAWIQLQKELNQRYPGYGTEITWRYKLEFYRTEKKWHKLGLAMNHYLANYPLHMSLDEMDGFSQNIFQNCPDQVCLNAALNWSIKADEGGNLTSKITYANLLYKTGHKKQAIKLTEDFLKRINIGGDFLKDDLAKMRKGKKTWSNS